MSACHLITSDIKGGGYICAKSLNLLIKLLPVNFWTSSSEEMNWLVMWVYSLRYFHLMIFTEKLNWVYVLTYMYIPIFIYMDEVILNASLLKTRKASTAFKALGKIELCRWDPAQRLEPDQWIPAVSAQDTYHIIPVWSWHLLTGESYWSWSGRVSHLGAVGICTGDPDDWTRVSSFSLRTCHWRGMVSGVSMPTDWGSRDRKS